MSQTAVALLLIAALVSVMQWTWVRASGHVDVRRLQAHSRQHVRWMLANSRHIQLAAGVLAVAAVCVQAAASVG